MSYSQWLGEIAAVGTPNISADMFIDVIRTINHAFDLYTRKNVVDCTCINDVYKTADPDCSICGGTGSVGGFDKQPDYSFLGYFMPDTTPQRGQPQREYSKAGMLDNLEGNVFTEPKWFDIIHNDDILIWKQKGKTTGFELKIMSKFPRFGFNNEIVFIKIVVSRNPYPLKSDNTYEGFF